MTGLKLSVCCSFLLFGCILSGSYGTAIRNRRSLKTPPAAAEHVQLLKEIYAAGPRVRRSPQMPSPPDMPPMPPMPGLNRVARQAPPSDVPAPPPMKFAPTGIHTSALKTIRGSSLYLPMSGIHHVKADSVAKGKGSSRHG